MSDLARDHEPAAPGNRTLPGDPTTPVRRPGTVGAVVVDADEPGSGPATRWNRRTLLAGAAGLIYALYQTTIWFFQGFTAGLIAFTAAVMGGIGNLRGAVLGGLIIGCIQQMADNRIGSEWTPAVVFGYLVLIMVVRPRGLLGEETREAG